MPDGKRFLGEEIGRSDDTGRPIRCGDRVKLTLNRSGYIAKDTQDGWGRDVRLDRADWKTIPDRTAQFSGTVEYYDRFCAFVVNWDHPPRATTEYDIPSPTNGVSLIGKSVMYPNDYLEIEE